jgi:hypothetical protein
MYHYGAGSYSCLSLGGTKTAYQGHHAGARRPMIAPINKNTTKRRSLMAISLAPSPQPRMTIDIRCYTALRGLQRRRAQIYGGMGITARR